MSNAIYDVYGNEVVISGNGTTFSPIKNIAHRGVFDNSTVYENTLEAFESAKAYGYDGFECDVYATSDSVLVLDHEGTITVGGVDYPISSNTYADLLALFPQLTTLEEALKFAVKTGMIPVIDRSANLSSAIATMVADMGMRGKVIYNTGANATAINTIKGIDPYCKCMINLLDSSTDDGAYTTWLQTLDSRQIVSTLSKDQGLDSTVLTKLDNARHAGVNIYLANFNRNQVDTYLNLYADYCEPASIYAKNYMTKYRQWLASY